MRKQSVFVVLTLMIPLVATSQSLSYEDADTPSEAVGMMKQSEQAAHAMREQCIARFPDLQPEIDANLQKWEITEAQVLKKTEVHWAAMVKKQPSIADALKLVDSAIKTQMDTITPMEAASKSPGHPGTDLLIQRCKRHFSDLASGVWRKRTPRAYAFMDRAP
jgi:hypothetical protein